MRAKIFVLIDGQVFWKVMAQDYRSIITTVVIKSLIL